MDGSTRAALTRRIAAYAATAGVVFAAPPADGQVVYHDYDPDRSPAGYEYAIIGLDFDQDGALDLGLAEWSDYSYYCGDYDYGFYFRGDERNQLLVRETYYGSSNLARLEAGALVGPNARFADSASGARYRCSASGGYSYGSFFRQEGYAGFRFVGGDGQRHYGWMRLRGGAGGDATVYEYAYEAAPDTPITAGIVSEALLNGALLPTTLPPEGGLLTYDYTVTNTTDAPLTLDLWVGVARQGGGYNAAVLLGSLQVPAGGAVSGAASISLPEEAPAGTYHVSPRLGDFAAGTFITYERYKVTKEGAGVGAEEEAPPAASRLLGEAVPNPTTGRTTFTLGGPQTQRVTVAVYDALGRQVAVLHDGTVAAGTAHRLVFDGSGLPTGVYVVRAVGEGSADIRVVTLAR